MNFLYKLILSFLSFFFVLPLSSQTNVYPIPAERQMKWHEAEMGVLFSYDLHVFDKSQYGQNNNRIEPIDDYNIFNPEKLDTDQWIKSAKAAGAKFAVLTATHETGFALYQSDVNPYCLKALKWQDGKGDIVRDFVNSCRKYHIMPGIYIGIRWNSLLGIHNFKVDGEGRFAKNRQLWYRHFCERMVEEICTHYGELFLIWFDGGTDDPGGNGPNVEPIVNKYQPDCLFYHNVERADFRWGGSETGTVEYPCWSSFPTPYSHGSQTEQVSNYEDLLKHGDPDGNYWLPAMADVPLRGANNRHEWFWEPGDEGAVYPLMDLMNIYYQSVGRNSTLVLGLTPDPNGLIPEGDAVRLKEFGDEINRRFASPLATTSGKGKQLVIKLDKKQIINHILIQEDIRLGERIRNYKVEAVVNGQWQTLCDGESVAYKRIEQINEVETKYIRLSVTKSVSTPQINNFSIYFVE
jgi:alpha-L-fucosidase